MIKAFLFVILFFVSSQSQAFSVCLFGIGWNCDDDQNKPALKRALVIGNSHYSFQPLKNPVNDATDVAEKLKQMGFEVTLLLDATEEQMGEAISDMGHTNGGVEIFYYAGHGVAIDKKNYLLPVDEEFKTENQVKYNAIDVDFVMDEIRSKDDKPNRLSVMILDACRNNPLQTASTRSIGNKKGLAPITKSIPGSMIMYSASANQVAYDGTGRNGLFTSSLLEEMDKPNIEIETMFKNVARKVEQATKGKQIPERVYTFTGNYELVKKIPQKPIKPEQVLSKKGLATIESQPGGALVVLEGYPLGKTPYQLMISPGRYQLEISKKGYQTQTREIVVHAEHETRKIIQLKKK